MTTPTDEHTGTSVGVRVQFERIRQNRHIPDLFWNGTDAMELEQAVRAHALPYMDYPDFGVHINGSTGWLDAGVYNAGNFGIAPAGTVDPGAAVTTGTPAAPPASPGPVVGWATLSGPAAWGLPPRT
jgi:hypothetical protein